mmetsp:Transcript_49319/g.154708  ORF Transcript_49319/g.154708 Transcript_49319/m.154708 type:complete len:269 (-) Transcript_49319:20-826(-)
MPYEDGDLRSDVVGVEELDVRVVALHNRSHEADGVQGEVRRLGTAERDEFLHQPEPIQHYPEGRIPFHDEPGDLDGRLRHGFAVRQERRELWEQGANEELVDDPGNGSRVLLLVRPGTSLGRRIVDVHFCHERSEHVSCCSQACVPRAASRVGRVFLPQRCLDENRKEVRCDSLMILEDESVLGESLNDQVEHPTKLHTPVKGSNLARGDALGKISDHCRVQRHGSERGARDDVEDDGKIRERCSRRLQIVARIDGFRRRSLCSGRLA